MKEFKYVSASQISTFQHPGGCNRKWWLNKIAGYPVPQHPSAALGERCHTFSEDVLLGRDGKHPADVVAIVTPALPLLRELAKAKPLVEIKMEHHLRNGLILTGRIDALVLDGFRGKEPTVIDHKTSSSEEWALTEEQLQNDLQMNIYAYDALTRVGPKQPWNVRVAHNFMRTKKGAYHRYTDALIPTPVVLSNWQKMQDITDEMRKIAVIPDPAAVPENRRACDKYGGCHFKDKCQALWAARGEQPANIYANIQEIKTPMPTQTPASVLESMALDADVIRAAVAKGTAIDDTPNKKYSNGVSSVTPTPGSGGHAGAINPPEAGADPRAAKAQATAMATKAAEPAPPPPAEVNMDDAMKLCIQLGWDREEVEADLSDDAILFIAGKNVKRGDVAELVRGTGVVNGEKLDNVIIEVKLKAKERPRRGAKLGPTPEDVAAAEAETHRAAVVDALHKLGWTDDDIADMPVETREKFVVNDTRRPANDGFIQRADNGIVGVAAPPVFDGSKEAPKTQGAAPARRPRNAEPRLTALGYPKDVIAGMDNAEMHRILDGEIAYVTREEIDAAKRALVSDGADTPGVSKQTLAQASGEADNIVTALEAKLAAESAEVLRLSEALAEAKSRNHIARPVGLTLYVDCAPEDGSAVDLDALLAPYFRKAEADGYVDEKTGRHSGPVAYYDLMPYNLGQKKVIGYLLSDIAKVQALPAVVVLGTSPMAARALEVLRPIAASVVVGRGR